MIGNKKIGIGIITYNRPEGLLKLYNSLPRDIIDELIIVNDGNYQSDFISISHLVVNNERNLGVGKSKNIALKYLMSKKCEYFFLLEDDVYIKDHSVFEKYISVSKITGLQHLNFSQHGNGNKDENGNPRPNLTVSYNDFRLPLYGFCVGAFSYYTNKCLSKIGFMDEKYYNAMEHIDHTISAFKAGMHTPFGYFADIPNSWEFIGDETWSEMQSVISSKENYQLIKDKALEYFKVKHGCFPMDFFENDTNKVVSMLKTIKSKNSLSYSLFKR